MRRCLLAAIVVLGAVVETPAARAQGPDPLWKRYYGWQLVAADAAAVGLVLAPLDGNARGAALSVGMTALFFNGPIVHMANGNPRVASRSLLRLPIFLLGRLVGWGVGGLLCQDTGCKDPIEDWSGYVALGSMLVFDWATAWKPERSLWATRATVRPAPPARALAVHGPRVLAVPLVGGTF